MPAVVKEGLAVVVPAGEHGTLGTISIAVAEEVGDVLDVALRRGGHGGTVTRGGGHPEGVALVLEGTNQVLEAVQRLVGPHNVGHVLGQLAHHIGVLGHDVAPHGHAGISILALSLNIATFLFHQLVAAVDEVDIHLGFAFLLHKLFGSAGAELLGLVAVDDEEGRVGDAAVGSDDALAQEVVDRRVGGVVVGAAVLQVLVEGHAERFLGMGEELQVDDLVAVRLAVGEVGGRQVGVLLLVEGVLRVVVAEVKLQGM